MLINLLTDLDFYKLTMGQFAWKYYPLVRVKYKFFNRTNGVKLAKHIDIPRLITELNNVRNLRFNLDELNYLNKTGLFTKGYLNFLNNLNLPPVYVDKTDKGELLIETEGYWCEAILWETLILSIVNELYYLRNEPTHWVGEFEENLDKKIKKIKEKPFKFVEFGTRRRFSENVQYRLLIRLCGALSDKKCLLGTSNVKLSKEFDIKPIGTMAHELPMVLAGIFDDDDGDEADLRKSHDTMLNLWYLMYGEDLSIALTDTFGSDFFFESFSKEQAEKWKGLRQDSGDPIEFAYKACRFYKKHGINPKDKLIVFSDGLDVDKIQKIEKEVGNNIKTAYGWGTNLTNDVGAKPLSIVVKAVEANGRPLVKLSDNLAKAVGDKKSVEKYKKAFGYKSNYEEPLVY